MDAAVSVVGLGKLGLPLAACLAKRGLEVVGVDVQPGVVDAINRGVSPIVEPGLDEIIKEHGGKRLRATLQHRQAIEATDLTFVLVATPSEADDSFSNRYVEEALAALGAALRESRKEYHLFVISSTVMPGSTQDSFIPLIERCSGRKLNRGFGVCFDPDFVALGDVVNGFLRPDLVIIGESEKRAGDRVEAVHRRLCENQPHVARMSIVDGEVAKVSLNAYMTVKISFANTLANLCERIPGADVDAITRAIGADRRISPHYFRGGLSFGGTCFPRDTRAFKRLAARCDLQEHLVRAAEAVNKFQDEHLVERVLELRPPEEDSAVGVLGLAFKPRTPVIAESPGIKLVQELLRHNIPVVAYDPLAVAEARKVLGDGVRYAASARECISQSALCVVTTCEPEFRDAFRGFEPGAGLTVLDCWRYLDKGSLDPRVKYAAWGATGSGQGLPVPRPGVPA